MKPKNFILSFVLFSVIGFSNTLMQAQCLPPKNIKAQLHNVTWQDVYLSWEIPAKPNPSKNSEIIEMFNNGPLISEKNTGPNGADVNMPMNQGEILLGVRAKYDTGHTTDGKDGVRTQVIDDFVLEVKTDVKTMDFYAFTLSNVAQNLIDGDITGAFISIYNENPIVNSSATPILGKPLENRLISSEFINCYTIPRGNYTDSRAPVFKVTVKVDTILPAGQYWVGIGISTKNIFAIVPYFPFVRLAKDTNTGNAWLSDNYMDYAEEITDSYTPHHYGIPFSVRGIPTETIAKGYKIFRNDSLIYDAITKSIYFMDIVPDTGLYHYDIKAVWTDNCVSDPIRTSVRMDQSPCLIPIPYQEMAEDFEGTFPNLYKCWQKQVIGVSQLKQIKGTQEDGNRLPQCQPHQGNGMLTYFSYFANELMSLDTAMLISPMFTTNNKKLILSFWMYRDNSYFNYPDLVNIYCMRPNENHQGKTPVLTVRRPTTQEPQTTIAYNGWYKHSVALDCSSMDVAQLTFEFIPLSGGNIYIDDIKIEEAMIENGDCDGPENISITYENNQASISWDSPGAFKNRKGEMTYAGGIGSHALGKTVLNYEMMAAIRWEANDLKRLGIGTGSTLTAISFVPSNSKKVTYTAKIWQGGKFTGIELSRMISNGQLIYEEKIPESVLQTKEWSIFHFESPVEIDPTKELWIGIHAKVNGSNIGPLYSDNDPLAYSKGNLLFDRDAEAWTTTYDVDNSYKFNWCIKGHVSVPENTEHFPNDPTSSVTEYVVYRDGVEIASVEGFSYTDQTIAAGKNDYEYAVSAHYNSGCFSPAIKESLPTAIQEKENNPDNLFKLYPNPANNVLQISGNKIKKVEIYNYIGQLLETRTQNCNQINVSSFKAGLYLVKIMDINGYNETKQVVISH